MLPLQGTTELSQRQSSRRRRQPAYLYHFHHLRGDDVFLYHVLHQHIQHQLLGQHHPVLPERFLVAPLHAARRQHPGRSGAGRAEGRAKEPPASLPSWGPAGAGGTPRAAAQAGREARPAFSRRPSRFKRRDALPSRDRRGSAFRPLPARAGPRPLRRAAGPGLQPGVAGLRLSWQQRVPAPSLFFLKKTLF